MRVVLSSVFAAGKIQTKASPAKDITINGQEGLSL